jgi:hypothetical protein
MAAMMRFFSTLSRSGEKETRPEDEFPEVPPLSVRSAYLDLSRAYLKWCIGMLLWSIGCVGYFILTAQTTEMFIGLCLGALLIAMIVSPATLFGGSTWYKRLGWVTILTGLFSVMYAYPVLMIALGVAKRVRERRYAHWPSFNDGWHIVLSILTVAVAAWTIRMAVRAGKLVRQLQRGDYVM